MGLLPENGAVSGQAFFNGGPILPITQAALNRNRGKNIAIIFQDALSALNPYRQIGCQMVEGPMQHEGLSRSQAEQLCLEMLEAVKLPSTRQLMQQYPHELSGGMLQRILIAMALLCRPKLLIADEPTTALDVTTQANILVLLKNLQKKFEMTMVLISHDLGVIAQSAEEVIVLYAGQVVEKGPAHQIFAAPRHPYTQALLQASPGFEKSSKRMPMISGYLPEPSSDPDGCRFFSRCPYARAVCEKIKLAPNASESNYCACPFYQ